MVCVCVLYSHLKLLTDNDLMVRIRTQVLSRAHIRVATWAGLAKYTDAACTSLAAADTGIVCDMQACVKV